MFETEGLELTFLIAVLVAVGLGVALAGIAMYRKRKKLDELEKSGEYSAVYDKLHERPLE
jgi:hypothetical protein